MFRYGGPIKEGIMTGMKEKQAINTVGSPLAPKDETGRGGYAFPLAAAAIPALTTAGRFLLRPFGQFVTRQFAGPNIIRTGKGGQKLLTTGAGSSKIPAGFEKSIFQPSAVGKYFMSSPEGRFVTGASGKAGAAGKKVFGAVKSLAKSPLTVGSVLYYGGGKLLPDGTPDPEDPKNYKPAGEGRQFTGDEAMVGDPRKPLPDSKPKPSQKDLTKSRIEATKKRYYDIFELDKMKKDSLYDSLLDASNIVQEEGADLKGALKSGTLQNRIINAISKNLDKSTDLKKQIDAAILKGEIEKDVAGAKPGSYLKQAEDYAEMKNVSVSQAYKDLGFDKRGDLNEGVQLYLKTNKVAPAGNDLATLARSYEIDIAGIEDTTTVKNKIKEKGYDEVGYLTEILSNPNANVQPGNYVINNRVLNVDADKNITPVF
tara:strand:+ start:169 stop:1452 length:1284 start_codon:yes stop_codon:yes gene_type:complete